MSAIDEIVAALTAVGVDPQYARDNSEEYISILKDTSDYAAQVPERPDYVPGEDQGVTELVTFYLDLERAGLMFRDTDAIEKDRLGLRQSEETRDLADIYSLLKTSDKGNQLVTQHLKEFGELVGDVADTLEVDGDIDVPLEDQRFGN